MGSDMVCRCGGICDGRKYCQTFTPTISSLGKFSRKKNALFLMAIKTGSGGKEPAIKGENFKKKLFSLNNKYGSH